MATKAEFLAVLLKGLKGFVGKLEENNNAGFSERYSKLRTVGTDQPVDHAKLGLNENKNRYRNVLPYDHCRVRLADGQVGDYINASYLPGFQNDKRYIASQGPVPTTIIDFWRMVWQEQVEVIVKVTKEVEGGTLKCHKYWPEPTEDAPSKMVLLGQVEVEFVSTESTDVFITRKFVLRKGSKELKVTMFSYEAWPDHGVPVTTREFLDFRKAVKTISDFTKSPVLVHCSAGVGRTGTYITVDRCLDAVESGKKSKDLDVDTTVKSLRMCRCFMVQTEPQYVFCYHALLDGIRESLKFSDVLKTLPRADQSFIEKDKEETDENQAAEDRELTGTTAVVGADDPANAAAELDIAEQEWELSKDSDYDVGKALSSLESRFAALMQQGKEMELSPATSDQIRAIVMAGKALDEKKKAARETKKAELLARKQALLDARERRRSTEKKGNEKTAAQMKAAKFMMSQSQNK